MHKRKGVSPIIATLLLILIAIAAGVATYAFVAGWISGATKNTNAQQANLVLDSAEASASGSISFNNNTYQFAVYVRNIGGINAEISAIYLTAPDGTYEKVDMTGVAANPGLTIAPYSTTALYFNATTVTVKAGNVYTVKVVCNDGSALIFNVRAHA